MKIFKTKINFGPKMQEVVKDQMNPDVVKSITWNSKYVVVESVEAARNFKKELARLIDSETPKSAESLGLTYKNSLIRIESVLEDALIEYDATPAEEVHESKPVKAKKSEKKSDIDKVLDENKITAPEKSDLDKLHDELNAVKTKEDFSKVYGKAVKAGYGLQSRINKKFCDFTGCEIKKKDGRMLINYRYFGEAKKGGTYLDRAGSYLKFEKVPKAILNAETEYLNDQKKSKETAV